MNLRTIFNESCHSMSQIVHYTRNPVMACPGKGMSLLLLQRSHEVLFQGRTRSTIYTRITSRSCWARRGEAWMEKVRTVAYHQQPCHECRHQPGREGGEQGGGEVIIHYDITLDAASGVHMDGRSPSGFFHSNPLRHRIPKQMHTSQQ